MSHVDFVATKIFGVQAAHSVNSDVLSVDGLFCWTFGCVFFVASICVHYFNPVFSKNVGLKLFSVENALDASRLDKKADRSNCADGVKDQPEPVGQEVVEKWKVDQIN